MQFSLYANLHSQTYGILIETTSGEIPAIWQKMAQWACVQDQVNSAKNAKTCPHSEFTPENPEPAMSNPRPACGPVEGFVWPSLGFRCSKCILYMYWQPVLILLILNLTFLRQVIFSATLSRLLPLHLGIQRIRYTSLC